MKAREPQNEWIRSKFASVLSHGNRESLNADVINRLSAVKANKIFYVGYMEKTAKAIANILVETAQRDIKITNESGKWHDSLFLKRKFYTDGEIVELCNESDIFSGKPLVRAFNELFDKFDQNAAMAKEIIKIVGLKREDETVYDIFKLHEISRQVADHLKNSADPAVRKAIVEEVIEESEQIVRVVKDLERNYAIESDEIATIDPEYLIGTRAIGA